MCSSVFIQYLSDRIIGRIINLLLLRWNILFLLYIHFPISCCYIRVQGKEDQNVSETLLYKTPIRNCIFHSVSTLSMCSLVNFFLCLSIRSWYCFLGFIKYCKSNSKVEEQVNNVWMTISFLIAKKNPCF